MKGIILAGGLGTRLHPVTKVINKHLLLVYDKPMIYFPLSTLMLAGIREILIIPNPEQLSLFQHLLGTGNQWGINISYCAKNESKGLADCFILAEQFIKKDRVCLILGNNLFHGSNLENKMNSALKNTIGATLFTYHINNPNQYGVVEFDENKTVLSIEEKPKQPKSNYAITGLYFYDNQVVDFTKSLKPSWKNKLEITDLNILYWKQSNLHIEILGQDLTWLDMGTHDSLLAASNYVATIETETPQGLRINTPEVIAWHKGYIDDEALFKLAQQKRNSSYRTYLSNLLKHEYAV